MAEALRVGVMMMEGTSGQDQSARRKFNASDVDGNDVSAMEDDRGKECPACDEIMFSPVAAHVVTLWGRRLLVHTCQVCNNWHNDQNVRPFRIPVDRSYFDLKRGETFVQKC